MLDNLLKFGTLFDWITPLTVIIQRVINAPVSDFGIPVDSGLDTRTIKKLLRYHDVKVWSVMYDFHGDVLMFTVRQEDATYVYDLLRDVGIPIQYVPNNIGI